MDDYKNSKEGRIVSQKYADILQMERPEPSVKHPRMSLGSRAKIFSPFAALRGFDDELAEEGAHPLRFTKPEPPDEKRPALSASLPPWPRGGTVPVRYFHPVLLCPADPPVGRYQTVTGTVQTLDPVQKTLRLVLDSPHTGPGVEKEKIVILSLENIASLI